MKIKCFFLKKNFWIMCWNVLFYMLNCLFIIIVFRLLFYIVDYWIIVDLIFIDWVYYGCVLYFFEIKMIIYKRISNVLYVNNDDLLFEKNIIVFIDIRK